MKQASTTEVFVETWGQLMEELYYESWDASIGRFRSRYVYRGQYDASQELSSSLVRLSVEKSDLASVEGHLLRSFRKYGHGSGLESDSIWNWLALAQHHGLPTRLLDWTYSPLVALHFATAKYRQGSDAAVWCVDHCRTNALLPKRLLEIARRQSANAFSVDMLDEAASSLQGFDRLARRPFVLFFEPPSLDARIVNQYALFALMSSPTALLHEWLARQQNVYRKVIIPAKLTGQVRDMLDQANVNERVLFPGLDGLARWLSRYYGPRF